VGLDPGSTRESWATHGAGAGIKPESMGFGVEHWIVSTGLAPETTEVGLEARSVRTVLEMGSQVQS
jgi:hypothetical protein